MKATEEFFRELKKRGTQSDSIGKMQTREELYKLLNYDPKADSWSG
jgi:2-methylisocitrate lyase-like PEP mutase family enzyme